MPSLSLGLTARRRLIVRRPQLGGERRELGLETAAGVGPGQAAYLHRALYITGYTIGPSTRYRIGRAVRAGPDEDPSAPDRERQHQAAQGGDAADQGGQLAGIVGDGQAHPRD